MVTRCVSVLTPRLARPTDLFDLLKLPTDLRAHLVPPLRVSHFSPLPNEL